MLLEGYVADGFDGESYLEGFFFEARAFQLEVVGGGGGGKIPFVEDAVL